MKVGKAARDENSSHLKGNIENVFLFKNFPRKLQGLYLPSGSNWKRDFLRALGHLVLFSIKILPL